MKQIDIDDSHEKILSLDMVDPEFWATNFIESRSIGIVDQLSKSESWSDLLKSAINADIDLDDKTAIVLNGIDAGIIKTAAQKQEEFEAAQSIEAPVPETPKQSLSVKVLAHSLALKIGAVNAMRTDGGKPYPVSAEALAAVRERYTDTVNAYNTKVSLGDAVSDDETAVVRLIQQGFALFAAINEAAETIIQSDNVTDPVATDPRWPNLNA